MSIASKVEKPRVQESKEPESSNPAVSKQYNVNFKPVRFLKGPDNSKILVTQEQCQKELKELYKNLEDGNSIIKAVPELALKNLSQKSNGTDFVKSLLATFSDGRQSLVSERAKLIALCLEKNFIRPEDFNKGFGEALFGLWMEASDFPGIEKNFANVFVLGLKHKSLKAVDLYIPAQYSNSDEKEYIFPTYQEVLEESIKLIDSQTLKVFS